jgi:hypothetical protein
MMGWEYRWNWGEEKYIGLSCGYLLKKVQQENLKEDRR